MMAVAACAYLSLTVLPQRWWSFLVAYVLSVAAGYYSYSNDLIWLILIDLVLLLCCVGVRKLPIGWR